MSRNPNHSPVSAAQVSQLLDAAQDADWRKFLWLRPDPSLTRYEQAWTYALTCNGDAYAEERLEPEGREFNDLCRQIEAGGWDAPFEQLRACLFFLQRSVKWSEGSEDCEDAVERLEAKYMACYQASCRVWEREAVEHHEEVDATYEAMAHVLARNESQDELAASDATLLPSKLRSTMSPQYTPHKKLSLRRHPQLNEAWLHDRICDDPSLLGLGDVRVLDRERTLAGGGRLDLLLLDDENDRRYEVEIQLGATDPSHIIRAIEYWDLERKKYPAYEHVAVIIAEDVTTRFLNVMSLMSGSIPMIAIQLDALEVGEHLLLNFVQVLDLTELRADDVAEEDSGGGNTDRSYWDAKAGKALMGICDGLLSTVQQRAQTSVEFNYLRGYIGLRSDGVVRNALYISPKPTRNYVNVGFRVSDVTEWKAKFEAAGVPVQSKRKRRFQLKLTPDDFREHKALIDEAVQAAINEAGV